MIVGEERTNVDPLVCHQRLRRVGLRNTGRLLPVLHVVGVVCVLLLVLAVVSVRGEVDGARGLGP